jgi:Bacterial Ig-like domain/Secretion system C-terminal sorting domain
MNKNKLFAKTILFFIAFIISLAADAQVIITTTATAYTQNFNTLKATAGTSTTLPTGWVLLETGTNANTSYTTDAGTSTTGDTYSYGTGTATDRAFGTLNSGSLNSTMGVQIKNSTGATITSLTISYTGEQWRCGTAGRTDQLDFQYSLNATSLSTGNWVDNNTLDFVSPSITSVGAKDGNAAANRTLRSAVITGLNIANNAIFWIRLNDFDASGADDGLAMDDFSIQLNGGDVTPPAISILNPANASTGAALNGNLLITFNENIQKGASGNITVKRTSDAVVINTTAVTDVTVTVSGATATIPFTGLSYSTAYYVEMPAATFKDLAGNSFAGISGTATWSFTTMPQPAATVSVNPPSLDFGFVAAGSTSVNKTFSYTTTNITAPLTLTSPVGFSISKDGTTFSSSLNYTITEAQVGQTVYVRFSPTVTNTSYNALINFAATGLNDNKEQLNGNSNVTTGPLNFYFGNLHAHSSYSDGNKDNTLLVPADDYAFAKNSLCFDFLGLSEHNHVAAGMHLADWQPGRTQASTATTSTFVGMYGMEWGVISGGGHVVVYGVDSLIGWDPGEYQILVPKSVYKGSGGLFDIINRHGNNALATLAHPNSTDYNDLLNGAYDIAADDAVVGSAVESGPAFSTNITYSDPGTSMSYLSYYKNMLSKGYHLGPTMDHDNHNLTFGRTTRSRLVVMAPSLTENSLLDGMRKMRFYASQDCSAKITFKINGDDMGSIVTKIGVPTISLGSITTNPVTSVNVMYGVPGSGTAATVLTNSTSGSFSFTDNGLTNLSQRYYYLDITESDGSRIVTAPIWYTRNDAAPFGNTTITSFFTINEADRVVLKWTTASEALNQVFDIERSDNSGRTYTKIGTITGKGINDAISNYGIVDQQPLTGVAYYRLVQKNTKGDISFTDIKTVDRSTVPASYFTIYPNPVHGILNVKVNATAAERTAVEIFDITGRNMFLQPVSLIAGEQNVTVDMSRLQKGSYILKLSLGGKTSTQMVNKF